MTVNAWEEIKDDQVDYKLWATFDQLYQFKLNSQRGNSPAITEPLGSITFDLAIIFNTEDPIKFNAKQTTVNTLIIEAFKTVFSVDQRIVVLDWQHPSYWFRPGYLADVTGGQGILPFPDGDYHIFLTEDMTQGTFGHPWEQTLCVFGAELTNVLAPKLTQQLPIKRRRTN